MGAVMEKGRFEITLQGEIPLHTRYTKASDSFYLLESEKQERGVVSAFYHHAPCIYRAALTRILRILKVMEKECKSRRLHRSF